MRLAARVASPARARARDAHGDELGGALAVPRDRARQLLRHLAQRCGEAPRPGARGVAQRRVARHAVRHQQHRVAGRGLAVDRESVVALVRRRAEQAPQQRRRDRRVRHEEGQHGRHVRLDHPRALGDAGERDRAAVDARARARRLRDEIRRHDGARRGGEAVRAQRLRGRRDAALDLVHRQRMADHARRRDEDVRLGASHRLRGQLRHRARVAQAALAHRDVRHAAFTAIARARPRFTFSRESSTGAPTTVERVNTPAIEAGTSLTISATSGPCVLMPARTPAARNPGTSRRGDFMGADG